MTRQGCREGTARLHLGGDEQGWLEVTTAACTHTTAILEQVPFRCIRLEK